MQHTARDAYMKGSEEDLQQTCDIRLRVQEVPGVAGGHEFVYLVGVEDNCSSRLALQREELTVHVKELVHAPGLRTAGSDDERLTDPLENFAEKFKESKIPKASCKHRVTFLSAPDREQLTWVGVVVQVFLVVIAAPSRAEIVERCHDGDEDVPRLGTIDGWELSVMVREDAEQCQYHVGSTLAITCTPFLISDHTGPKRGG